MQYRDLTIIPLTDKQHLVVTCDASASIGEKPADFLRTPTPIVSAYCTRVSLFELLAFGATPINIIHLVGNEFEETGRKALDGVYNELAKAQLKDVEINGSTEENMPTKMTSIAVTGIGVIDANAYNLSPLQAGDLLYRLGEPLVGQAVLDNEEKIATYEDIRALRACEAVRDIVPVGSKGMAYEAALMGNNSHLLCQFDSKWLMHPSLNASSGPATSLLIGVNSKQKDFFEKNFLQATYIGKFVRIL